MNSPAKITCPKHGPVTPLVVRNKRFQIDQGCPLCAEEKDAEYQKCLEKKEQRAKLHQVRYLLEQAHIPKRFIDVTIDNYITKEPYQVEVKKRCRAYLEQSDQVLRNGFSLILCGDCGTGKTHLAIALLRAIITSHICTGLYATTPGMIQDIRSSYSDRSFSTQTLQQKYTTVQLLILDEIGVQSKTYAEKKLLFEIIDSRYCELLPTIFVSNLTFKEMTQCLDERLIDRIRTPGSQLIPFNGKSWRKLKGDHR